MKGLKKLIALSLSVVLGIMCLISASSMAVLASSGNENDELIHEATIISEKFIDPELVGTKLSEVDPSNQVTTFNAYGERHVLSATFTTKKIVYVRPTGQPELGYAGGTGAIISFIKIGGSTFKFSVTVDAKPFTFVTETGKATYTGTAYSAPVPKYAGNYAFEFVKDFVITTRKYDIYKYTSYQYSIYVHDPAYSLRHKWVKL